jgi:hypothetical protein
MQKITSKIKKTENLKPSISKVNRQITIGFVLVTMALVVIIAYFSLSKAIIYITPELTEVNNESEVQILPAVTSTLTSSNILPGIVTSTEITLTQTFTPSVTELKEAKASGQVKIINNYSRSQTLVATTRLLAPNNNLYRLTETVIIPAGSSLFAQAVADQAGDAYQISSSTRFTIPGLWEGIRDYIYAESTEQIKRQNSIANEIKPQDFENARTILLQKTEDEAKKQITNQAEYYIISDSKLISASSSQAVGKSVATFDFTVTAKVSIIAFKKIDLETVSVNNLKASLNDSQTYVSHNPDSIKYSFKAYDQNNSTATIMVNIIGLASTDLENNFSKKDILGLTKEDVIKYFKTKPGVKQVEVIFSPAWVKSVPPLEDHVEINIVK